MILVLNLYLIQVQITFWFWTGHEGESRDPAARHWWSMLVDWDTLCFTQSALVGSLMPTSFIFSLPQPSISEEYGLPLVLYSWCFGIFLISLLQLIFVCLLLSTSCDICGRGVLNTFYPSCNVDPLRPNFNLLQTTVAFKSWSKTSLYYLFWLVLIWTETKWELQ